MWHSRPRLCHTSVMVVATVRLAIRETAGYDTPVLDGGFSVAQPGPQEPQPPAFRRVYFRTSHTAAVATISTTSTFCNSIAILLPS